MGSARPPTTLKDRSAAVAEGCLSTLRRVLNLAVANGVLERNPVPRIHEIIQSSRKRGARESSGPKAWTREEVATLLDEAIRREPALYPALRFALATGARRGELLALQWEDIDFSNRRVQIRRTMRLNLDPQRPA